MAISRYGLACLCALSAISGAACSSLEVEVHLPYAGTTVPLCEQRIDVEARTREGARLRLGELEVEADRRGFASLKIPYFHYRAGRRELVFEAFEGQERIARETVPIDIPVRPVAVRPRDQRWGSYRWEGSLDKEPAGRQDRRRRAHFSVTHEGKLVLAFEGCGLASARIKGRAEPLAIEKGRSFEAEIDLMPHLLAIYPKDEPFQIALQVANIDGQTAGLSVSGRMQRGREELIARRLWGVDQAPLAKNPGRGAEGPPYPLVIVRADDRYRPKPFLPEKLRGRRFSQTGKDGIPSSIRISEDLLGGRSLGEVQLVARVRGSLEYAGRCGGYLTMEDSASYRRLQESIEKDRRMFPGHRSALEPLLSSYSESAHSLHRYRHKAEVELFEARTGELLEKKTILGSRPRCPYRATGTSYGALQEVLGEGVDPQVAAWLTRVSTRSMSKRGPGAKRRQK
ncbi:MAG: hypothetical protein JXR96_02865 [Deltaproteobacteria bacterium]|nr:hypothetical protein [Deltaproteobacteria bacterium]